MLAWLSERGRLEHCGSSSISSFALETLGLRPRTTRSRLALYRFLQKHPFLERAFLDGEVSACQLPYIARLIDAVPVPEELLSQFIRRNSRRSVDVLRHTAQCQERRARMKENGTRREDDAARRNEDLTRRWREVGRMREETEIRELVERRRHGDSGADAEDAGLDEGLHAQADREPGLEPDSSGGLRGDSADDLAGELAGDPTGDPAIDSAGDPAGDHTGDHTGDPASDPTGDLAGDPDGDPEMVSFSFKHPVAFRVPFDEMMELTRKVLGHEAPIYECIEAMLAEVAWPGIGKDGPEPGGPAVRPAIEKLPPMAIPVRHDAVAHAKETLARAAEYLEDVEQIDAIEEPQSPEEALLILRQIQLLRAPGKVLLAHLTRDLRRVGAMELLGYTSMGRMVEDLLKISERSARNRVAESLMFETSAAMEEAFATGRISTMQAYLIRQLKHGEGIDEFVDRARETTWRQFQREYRMLTLMRKCHLGQHALRPISRGNIEEALIEALGGDREKIEESLRIRGIAALPPGGSADPAENPILMDRLETMVQLLALRQWEEVPETGEADRQTLAYLEASTITRIPLPRQTYIDLKHVLWEYRGEEPHIRPPSFLPRLPEWAAMAMLFEEVREIWERQDPERVPVRVKIMERDHYRCVVPGCTRRDQLEAHHIAPRSQGGSNDPGNLAVLCHGHHQHGAHKGHLKIRGTAPHALRYELGKRRDGTPLLIYRGNRLVRGPFDP